jgi:drug/metabolite transporter (DMT)-like permease
LTPSLATRRALAAPSPQMLTGFAALLGAALAMSISPTLVRLSDVGPFASAFWRVALALPLLWAWMRAAETPAARAAAARFTLPTILAGFSFAGDLFFWHLAARHTTIANATFFATTAPIWVVVFGWLLLGQRVERAVLAGLALCIGGGAALVVQSFAFDPGRLPGDAFGIVTGIFFGLYFLAVRAARGRASAARVTFELTLVTAVVLGGVAFAFEPRILPHSPSGWPILAALAFVSHSAGQGLLSVALGRLPAAFSSLVIFLEAVAAAVFAWIVLGEPVTPVQAVGGLVIVAGIWIARPRERTAE